MLHWLWRSPQAVMRRASVEAATASVSQRPKGGGKAAKTSRWTSQEEVLRVHVRLLRNRPCSFGAGPKRQCYFQQPEAGMFRAVCLSSAAAAAAEVATGSPADAHCPACYSRILVFAAHFI